MTVQLRVNVRDTVSPALRELMLRTGDIDDTLQEIGDSLRTSTQQRIEAGRTPDGEEFEKHSDATIAKRGAGAAILRDEINLYDLPNAKVFGSKVAVGTNLIYGRIHQLGGQAGRITARVTIPARPYLGLSAEDRTEIVAIVTDRIKGLNP